VLIHHIGDIVRTDKGYFCYIFITSCSWTLCSEAGQSDRQSTLIKFY